MGRLNVTILRYLSKEDFRVLTAVSSWQLRCLFWFRVEKSNLNFRTLQTNDYPESYRNRVLNCCSGSVRRTARSQSH